MKLPLTLASVALIAFGGVASAQPQAPKPATAPAPAAAAPGAAAPAAALTPADRKFIEQASLDGSATVAAAQLALQKSSNDAVKQFAQRMVADHTKANDQLKQIAMQKGVSLPSANPKQDAEAKQLEKLNGAAFDKTYAQIAFKDHDAAVKLFHDQEWATKDRELHFFTGDTLPLLEEHRDMAEKLAATLRGPAHPAQGKKEASPAGG